MKNSGLAPENFHSNSFEIFFIHLNLGYQSYHPLATRKAARASSQSKEIVLKSRFLNVKSFYILYTATLLKG